MGTPSTGTSRFVIPRRGRVGLRICGVVVAGGLVLAGCDQTGDAQQSSSTPTPMDTTASSSTPRTPSPGEYRSDPTGGDQASAETAVKQGYVKKLASCAATRDAAADVAAIDWLDFRENQEAAGLIKDANAALGGHFTARYADGRWFVEYDWC